MIGFGNESGMNEREKERKKEITIEDWWRILFDDPIKFQFMNFIIHLISHHHIRT